MKTASTSHIDADRDDAHDEIAKECRDERSTEQHVGIPIKTIQRVKLLIPLHNEEENIENVTTGALQALTAAGYQPSILLVDDGSTDNSRSIIAALANTHAEINYISFSRNFGKEAAIMAGLQECGDDFDVLAYMDSDGQHSTDDLLNLLTVARRSDVDLVCGARVDRDYQTIPQKVMTRGFYRIFHALTESTIDEGVGDFNVLTAKVVRALREMHEEHPFMKGLVSWVGFKKVIVPITIRPRAGGQAKSSTVRMLRLALHAILSFSSWPLRAWSIVGILSGFCAFAYLVFVIIQTTVYGQSVPGYATTVVLLLGLGGLQLLSIGILGEYVSRIYGASKRRPRYIIAERG